MKYDSRGRVRESRTGREYTFTYSSGKTTVKELTGQRHTFEQNGDGITVKMNSSSGVKWEIELNDWHFVTVLKPSGKRYDFTYDDDHSLTKVVERVGSNRRSREYGYDDRGRLTSSIADGSVRFNVVYTEDRVQLDGSEIDFAYDIEDHRIVSIEHGEDQLEIEYDPDGFVKAFHRHDESVWLERDSLGRITETRYPGMD